MMAMRRIVDKVIFRKHSKHSYRIIALFPEIPGNIHDDSLCLSFVYTDTDAFLRETGITYPRPSVEQGEADIIDTINETTKAEPFEYEQLKNIIESDYGLDIEVRDEINDEMHLKRYSDGIIEQMAETNSKELIDNTIDNNEVLDITQQESKESFWQTVLKEFIFIVVGLPYLLFIIFTNPDIDKIIFIGVIGGIIVLCYYVGRLFSSPK